MMPPTRAPRTDDHVHNHAAYLTQSLPILLWFSAFVLSKCRPDVLRVLCMRFYLLPTSPPSSSSIPSTAAAAHSAISSAGHTGSVWDKLRIIVPHVVLSFVHDIAALFRLPFQLIWQHMWWGRGAPALSTSSMSQTAVSDELSRAGSMHDDSTPSALTALSSSSASIAAATAAAAAQAMMRGAPMLGSTDGTAAAADATRESAAMTLLRCVGSVMMHTSHAALTDTFLTHLMIDFINKNNTYLLKDFAGAFVSTVIVNLFLQRSVRYIDTDGRFLHSRPSAASFSTAPGSSSSTAFPRAAAKAPSPLLQALAPAAFFLLSVLSTTSAHPINVLTQTRLYNLNLEDGSTARPIWLSSLTSSSSSTTPPPPTAATTSTRSNTSYKRNAETVPVTRSTARDAVAATIPAPPSPLHIGGTDARSSSSSTATSATNVRAAGAIRDQEYSASLSVPHQSPEVASTMSSTHTNSAVSSSGPQSEIPTAPSMVYLCGGKGFTYALAGFRCCYYNDLEQINDVMWSCMIDTVELGMHWMLEGYNNSLQPLFSTSTASPFATPSTSVSSSPSTTAATAMSHDVSSANWVVSDSMGEYMIVPNTSVDMLLWNILHVLSGITIAFVARRLPKLWGRYREHIPLVSIVLNKLWPPPPTRLRVPDAVVENASAQQAVLRVVRTAEQKARGLTDTTIPVPAQCFCPITYTIMRDPVSTADGFTYEREAIMEWLRVHNTSPMTNLVLPSNKLKPNMDVRTKIESVVKSYELLVQ